MTDLEKRVVTLENEIARMEARRRALVPAALDDDPNVQLVLRDSMDAVAAKWKQVAAQKDLDQEQTRFTAAKAEARRELERIAKEGEQKELAELVAAIEYYERTGQSPPGYDISG